jgi:CRP-like cAMP-binding protein
MEGAALRCSGRQADVPTEKDEAMQTVGDLKQAADRELFRDAYLPALQLYAYMVEAQPDNLDARLRVADTLMALGELQRAAVVYTALARHAALAGYPLRALVALKVLSVLEPRLGVLLHDIARLYGRDSARIGRSVRRALPALSAPLPAAGPELTRAIDKPALVARAEQVSAHYEPGALVYPEKLIPLPLLSLLPEQEFASVLDVLQVVRVRPDTFILREGDAGRSFFVLARGTVEVLAERGGQPVRLAALSEGSIFGEMALLSASPRTASVRALTDCDLLEFDCAALGAASGTVAHLSDALSGFARERLLSNVTATSALFRPLDAKQRVDLVRRFVSVVVPPKQAIIREGDAGAGLYVVLRGEVCVTRFGDPQPVAQLGPSEVFGEIALLTHEPATATVSATDQGASLLFLSRDYFERLLAAVPEVRSYFERLSEDRLLDMRLSLAEVDPEAARAEAEVDVEVLL